MKNNTITHLMGLLLLCLMASNILNAQCNDATYSTNKKDGWLSCQKSINPNNNRGLSHWLQYDLGYIYELGDTRFWNYNVANQTGRGIKQLVLDYSLDGTIWIEAGIFQIPEADGTPNYEGATKVQKKSTSRRVTTKEDAKEVAVANSPKEKVASTITPPPSPAPIIENETTKQSSFNIIGIQNLVNYEDTKGLETTIEALWTKAYNNDFSNELKNIIDPNTMYLSINEFRNSQRIDPY